MDRTMDPKKYRARLLAEPKPPKPEKPRAPSVQTPTVPRIRSRKERIRLQNNARRRAKLAEMKGA